MPAIPEQLAAAIRLHQEGRLQEAEQNYRQILSTEPNHAAAWHHLGVVAFQTGKHEAAERCIERALELRPHYAEAYGNLGLILRSQGKHDEAVACLRKALQLKPDFANANCNLGTALLVESKWDEAAALCRRALELKPDYALALIGLGTARKHQENLDEAVMCFRRGLELLPDCAEGHNNLGSALRMQGKLDEAAASYRRALEYKPQYAETRLNLGLALQDSGLLEEAIECYHKALELKADYADAVSNLGTACHEQGKYEEAADCYGRTLELDPNSAGGHSNWATLMLLRGDFEHGWPEYEWRWKTGQLRLQEYSQPRWEGEPLAGKTILLHAEQGLGDTIQFIRYTLLIKEQNPEATVVVECQKALLKLLECCRSIDRLIARGDELPACDMRSALLSLPEIFKTNVETIPGVGPYLFAETALVDQWRQALNGISGFRVGINWRGRADRIEWRKRDIPVELMAALAAVPGVQLISLQKDAGQEDFKAAAGRLPIIDLGEFDTAHGPFMDTAAIMKNVDLVISSDTAVPHLAGALGIPVWVALPFVPDWRWLLDRSDSPWYPTMRLFRQKKPGDWAGVFAEIGEALRELVR